MALCGRTSLLKAGTTLIRDDAGSNVLAFVLSSESPDSCPGLVVLSAQEYKDMKFSVAAFGFDETLFSMAFAGALVLFAVGLGVGLVISTLRKARI